MTVTDYEGCKASDRQGNYELHIGRVLKVEHWDRKKRKPKR